MKNIVKSFVNFIKEPYFNEDKKSEPLRYQIGKIGCFFTNKPKNFQEFANKLQRENNLYPEGYFGAYDDYSMKLYKGLERITDNKAFYRSKEAFQECDKKLHANQCAIKKQLLHHWINFRPKMKDALLGKYIKKSNISPKQRSQLQIYRLLDRTRLLMYLSIFLKTPLSQEEIKLIRQNNVDAAILIYKKRLPSCLSQLAPQRRENRIYRAIASYHKLRKSEYCLENGDELIVTLRSLKDKYKVNRSLDQLSSGQQYHHQTDRQPLKIIDEKLDENSSKILNDHLDSYKKHISDLSEGKVDDSIFKSNQVQYQKKDEQFQRKVAKWSKLDGSDKNTIKRLNTARMLMNLSVYLKAPFDKNVMSNIANNKEPVLNSIDFFEKCLSRLNSEERMQRLNQAMLSYNLCQSSKYRLQNGNDLIAILRRLDVKNKEEYEEI